MGWGLILGSITDLVGKVLDIAKIKLLRAHSDKMLELELALDHVMNKVPYDDHDDLLEADLKRQIKATKDAYFRDLALMSGEK